jgi:outer membrane protein TolC
LHSTIDKQESLLATERDLLAEVARTRREEEYLLLKVRQAREQVRYYERLLEMMKRDWAQDPGLASLVRGRG